MIVINGDFLCRNLTGIERFANEITLRLDKLINNKQIKIYIPSNATNIPNYQNIEIIKSDIPCNFFPKWEHKTFRNYVKKNNLIPLDFSNVTPLGTHGIVFIHDIYAKLYPKDFNNFRDKLISIYMRFMYRYAVKHAKLLLTVSNFSKEQLINTYKISSDKIKVIPNGWDHFKIIKQDESVFDDFPQLKAPFYFTLGSLSKRKNLNWILKYALSHSSELFAISGKSISGLLPEEIGDISRIPNIILLGYLTDEKVKALMAKCKAFIFPSYYEGFGIPPLEALSVGAQIIISNTASLPEIYKNTAHYIDPYNTNCDLDKLLNEKVDSPCDILSYYTYDNATKKLYDIINNFL